MMRANSKVLRKTAGLLAGAMALAAAAVGFSSGVAGATYLDCTGEKVFDVPGMQGVELFDVPGSSNSVATFDLGFELAPGRYSINVSSFDGYIDRTKVPEEAQEKSERWFAEFLDAGGNVVGQTSATTDLPDDTDVAELIDTYSGVELTGTATQVRLVHVTDFASLNLVHVGCIGFDVEQTPVTTWETTPPPVETTPTTPATTPATVGAVLVTQVTVAPTAAPTTVPVVRAATLPFTGDHTGLIAVAGGATLMLGLAFVAKSRQLEA